MMLAATKKQKKERILHDKFREWIYIDHSNPITSHVLRDDAPEDIAKIYDEWLESRKQPDPDDETEFWRSLGFVC